MPQEVFDLWIAPHITDYGWPFTSADMPVTGTKWRDFFAHRPLRQWAQFAWHHIHIPARLDIFHPDTVWRVHGIIGHCRDSLQTAMANIEGTRDRYRACASFIVSTGRFPAPLVGVYDEHSFGFELVDGHHRLAALFGGGVPTGFQMPIWLGRRDDT